MGVQTAVLSNVSNQLAEPRKVCIPHASITRYISGMNLTVQILQKGKTRIVQIANRCYVEVRHWCAGRRMNFASLNKHTFLDNT